MKTEGISPDTWFEYFSHIKSLRVPTRIFNHIIASSKSKNIPINGSSKSTKINVPFTLKNTYVMYLNRSGWFFRFSYKYISHVRNQNDHI